MGMPGKRAFPLLLLESFMKKIFVRLSILLILLVVSAASCSTYKKERVLAGKPYFSVASGGGTGRTLHPDNMAAGPASYGMTDTMGRMHSDAQFAGSSSVPAHVEMMGFLGIGNNPMVGCTVACAVDVATALSK